MVGLSGFANYVPGTIENNTEQRWKRVTVRADLSVKGQTVNDALLGWVWKSFDYAKIGETIGYTDANGGGQYVGVYEKPYMRWG